MLKRVKRAVVESYIGAIALGYLLAETIIYFVNIFVRPVTMWVNEKNYGEVLHRTPARFSFQNGLPDAVGFVLCLVLWYLLLSWLYMKPTRTEASEPPTEPR